MWLFWFVAVLDVIRWVHIDKIYSPQMVVTIYKYTIENNFTKKRKKTLCKLVPYLVNKDVYKEKNTHKQMACTYIIWPLSGAQ